MKGLMNHLFKVSQDLQLYFNRNQHFNSNLCKSSGGILNFRQLVGSANLSVREIFLKGHREGSHTYYLLRTTASNFGLLFLSLSFPSYLTSFLSYFLRAIQESNKNECINALGNKVIEKRCLYSFLSFSSSFWCLASGPLVYWKSIMLGQFK